MRISLLLIVIFSSSLSANDKVDDFLLGVKPECKKIIQDYEVIKKSSYALHANYVFLEMIEDLFKIRHVTIKTSNFESQQAIDKLISLRLTVLLMHAPFSHEQVKGLKKILDDLNVHPLVHNDYPELMSKLANIVV